MSSRKCRDSSAWVRKRVATWVRKPAGLPQRLALAFNPPSKASGPVRGAPDL
jgi:hypothetical protein